MMYKTCVFFLVFLLFSLVGWLVETLLYVLRDKKMVKRGFLFGPICPIYGAAAIVCALTLYNRVDNTTLLFFYGLGLCGILEYITHYVMEKAFHAVWWDYSNRRFNINGRVYLKGLIFFGLGAILMVKVLLPNVFWVISLLPKNAVYAVSMVTYTLLIVDISTTIAALTNSVKALRKLTDLGIAKGQHGIDITKLKYEDTKLTIKESKLIHDLVDSVNNEHSVISRIKRKYPNFSLKKYRHILDVILDMPMEDKGRKDLKVYGSSESSGDGEDRQMRNADNNYGFETIKVKKVERLGELPPLLTFDNGEKVDLPEKWAERRKEVYAAGVERQYGVIPPEPEVFEVELLQAIEREVVPVRIVTGTKECPVTMSMTVFKPAGPGPFPVVVDGDMCFEYIYDKDFVSRFTGSGIALAAFNRTELAPDIAESAGNGQLSRAYPGLGFGALAAWSWGYSRCLDAVERLGLCEGHTVAFTGHSRGGKTALLAGACDERADIVNPNGSGAGGCGCFRVRMQAEAENGELLREEGLDDIIRVFGYWFSDEAAEYVGREDELPFDSHFVKALVAPRTLLMTEAESDIWANPVGGLISDEAAREVFDLLGAGDRIVKIFRPGFHYHDLRDIDELVDIIKKAEQEKENE